MATNASELEHFEKQELELLINDRKYHSAEESCTNSESEQDKREDVEKLEEETFTEDVIQIKAKDSQPQTKIIVIEPWWRMGRVSI